ncbi:MAG: serine/threonine protein kinase [Gemmatimonadetes bacterium]|nr:serine/threonine protein kinase [Gemmatimonadota bacterium]
MKPETWQRLDRVFFEALELPTAERAAYLDRVCGGDTAFRREVEAVLAGHAAAGGTRDSDRLLSPAITEGVGAAAPGATIGAYAIEAVIGRGGMGEVYRARRADAQYEQQVAIKLIRPGRDTDDLMRRFRTERQILARLVHPNIATLLDGGVTDQGQPYLVMQYVDGQPLTTHANERGLDLEARLQLFLTVCEAVQFAHANLVVHRDLKPSNILVTTRGEVRLLDFGIAKIIDAGQDSSTTGDLLLLTPEHAAPEQFVGGTITTATDVYALGVLLYELLTGSRPFQFTPAAQLHQAVGNETPTAPSRRAADAAWLTKAKLARSPVEANRLAGDLDAIVLKALRKEPARRYASAAEMADDVRRHLNRDDAGRQGPPVRAVLHHQGGESRIGPGARRLFWDRHSARRRDCGRFRGRPRNPVRGLASGGRRHRGRGSTTSPVGRAVARGYRGGPGRRRRGGGPDHRRPHVDQLGLPRP